jgi:hypothetical protein
LKRSWFVEYVREVFQADVAAVGLARPGQALQVSAIRLIVVGCHQIGRTDVAALTLRMIGERATAVAALIRSIALSTKLSEPRPSGSDSFESRCSQRYQVVSALGDGVSATAASEVSSRNVKVSCR